MQVKNINSFINTRSIAKNAPKEYQQAFLDKNGFKGGFQFPSYGFYNTVSFTGGKSLNLALTKQQLDTFSRYPDRIKDGINKVLLSGNPDNLTLIDVHLDSYDNLNNCRTLDEAKVLYPEFKDVLSDKDIETSQNAFIDKVKNGEIEELDKDADLALQLLQLYWGAGFSLRTLQEKFSDKNIYAAIKKLNIPRFDRIYAEYLKLSDKDYNERFTAKMSELLTGKPHTAKKDAITQEEEQTDSKDLEKYIIDNSDKNQKAAEAVKAVNSGRTLSDEHKKALSESMLRYYSEHPERISEMSGLRKKFFEQNPDEKEIFSLILLRAWSYKEAKPIRKAMSEFMSMRKNMNAQEAADLLLAPRRNLKGFWAANGWAKDAFSKCMKMSWARQKELKLHCLKYDPVYEFDAVPQKMKYNISSQLETDRTVFEESVKYMFPDYSKEERPFLVESYCNDWYIGLMPGDRDSSLYNVQTVMGIILKNGGLNEIQKLIYSISKSIIETAKDNPEYEKYKNLYKAFYKTVTSQTEQSVPDLLLKFYAGVNFEAVRNNDMEFVQKLDKNFNRIYNKIENKNLEEMSSIISSEIDSLRW